MRNEKSNSQPHISSTIEFYPEEGKYHYTGHRNCQIRQAPEETKRLGETCPVCGRPLTLGVTYRVEELISSEPVAKTEIESDKFNVRHIRNGERPSYLTIVPLIEILAESRETSVGSRKVLEDYDRLIEKFGSEFAVLLRTSFEEIAEIAGAKVAEGIKKVRAGEIVIDPGYDGVYGMVKIWENCQNQAKISSQNGGQASFF